jgi:SAM-dependent methyltransferase
MQKSTIKDNIKKQYAKIALSGNSESCCMPGDCGCSDAAPKQVAQTLGYDSKELGAIPEASILGVGCGAPLNFADMKEGETVVDLGSGAGIDVFLAANKIGKNGKAIGIDMTDEMLEKARKNAKEHGYSNVEFRKGDIEKRMPVDDNSVDLVISNCVINLTTDKVEAFKEVRRILRPGGRMVISDLVSSKEVAPENANADKWCSCIDGALTRENYLESIRKAGFDDVQVLSDRVYMDESQTDGRKITSLIIKAVK